MAVFRDIKEWIAELQTKTCTQYHDPTKVDYKDPAIIATNYRCAKPAVMVCGACGDALCQEHAGSNVLYGNYRHCDCDDPNDEP